MGDNGKSRIKLIGQENEVPIEGILEVAIRSAINDVCVGKLVTIPQIVGVLEVIKLNMMLGMGGTEKK